MKNINGHIMKFIKFLNVSELIVDELMADHDWEQDVNLSLEWMQANWELLVERELLSQNASLPPALERFHMLGPEKTPTHNLIIKEKANPDQTYVLAGFLNIDEKGSSAIRPPYNGVWLNLLKDQLKQWRPPHKFFLSEVDFFIVAYEATLELI
jgi:hypothetical protein